MRAIACEMTEQDKEKLTVLRDNICTLMTKAGLHDSGPACKDALDVLLIGTEADDWSFVEWELFRHLKRTIFRSMMNPVFSFNGEVDKLLNPRPPQLVEMVD